MAKPSAVFSIASLSPYLPTLGMVSLLLVGTGTLLEAIATYVDLANAAFQGYSIGSGGAIWAAFATLLLIISIAILFAAISVRRGVFPKIAILGLFLAAVSLFIEGAGTLALSTAASSPTVSGLAIAAGVILLIALFISTNPSTASFPSTGASTGSLLAGAIFALVFVILLIVRIADLGGNFSQVGGSSLNSYLLSTTVSQPTAIANVENLLASVGILGTTSLAYISYLTVAIGLLFWAMLRNTKLASMAWIALLVGFLLYGIDMAWGNASALANANYGFIDWTTEALPYVSAIILLVAAFIIMATAVMGLVFYGGSLWPGMAQAAPVQTTTPTTSQATPQQAQQVRTQAAAQVAPQEAPPRACPNCGTMNASDSVYCKKCGNRMAADWFSAAAAVTGKACRACGTENPSDHLYCKKCGKPL